jgi:hypothetical protein
MRLTTFEYHNKPRFFLVTEESETHLAGYDVLALTRTERGILANMWKEAIKSDDPSQAIRDTLQMAEFSGLSFRRFLKEKIIKEKADQ